MLNSMRNQQAFTLMELMISISIIAIMAAFAIPNYSASIERAHRRDGTNNLLAIHAANQAYHMQEGVFWPTSVASVCHHIDEINPSLRLAIIEDGVEYICRGGGTFYSCWACRGNCTGCPPTEGNPFMLKITNDPIDVNNPTCTGTCP